MRTLGAIESVRGDPNNRTRLYGVGSSAFQFYAVIRYRSTTLVVSWFKGW